MIDQHRADAERELSEAKAEITTLTADLQAERDKAHANHMSYMRAQKLADDLKAIVDKLRARIRVQDLTLDRMHKTQDGVPVVQWDRVWQATKAIYSNGDPVIATEKTFVMYRNGKWEFDEDATPQDGPVYSSFAAAEQAAQDGGEG